MENNKDLGYTSIFLMNHDIATRAVAGWLIKPQGNPNRTKPLLWNNAISLDVPQIMQKLSMTILVLSFMAIVLLCSEY